MVKTENNLQIIGGSCWSSRESSVEDGVEEEDVFQREPRLQSGESSGIGAEGSSRFHLIIIIIITELNLVFWWLVKDCI